jgi:hypothetical protein
MHDPLSAIIDLEKSPGDIAICFLSMSNDDYHAAPGWSHSQSKDLSTTLGGCPELFFENHLGAKQPEWKKTEAKSKGSAVHTITLEGRATFEREYVIEPEFSGKGSKAAKAEWEEENEGTNTLKEKWLDAIEGMSRRILGCQEFKGIRNGSEQVEVAFFVRNASTNGLLIKAKFDVLNQALAVAGDVKTSGTGANLDAFAKACADFAYVSQAAWYLFVLSFFDDYKHIEEFVFFVVGSTSPHLPATYRLRPADLAIGYGAVQWRLDTLAECLASGVWPGLNNDELTDLDFKPWQLKALAQ